MFTYSSTWIFLAAITAPVIQLKGQVQEPINQNKTTFVKCRQNSSGIVGVCVPIYTCPQAVRLLLIYDANTLRRMFCGRSADGDVKVCCQTNETDDHIIFSPEKSGNIVPNRTEIVTTTEALNEERLTPEGEESLHGNRLSPENTSENLLPSRNVCGVYKAEDRIVGGVIAALDDFPWLVRIKYLFHRTGRTRYACAGSLINNRYVVTAAHCILVPETRPTEVRLGEWDAEAERDCYGDVCSDPPVDVRIEQIIYHPAYSPITKMPKADIALIRLEHAVNYSDYIRPICLPTTGYTKRQDYISDSSYTTAGWGVTELGEPSAVKRKVKVSAVPMSTCRVSFNFTRELENEYICAGGKVGEDSCRGDSGGSLARVVSENYQANWYLFGITSFGTRKCGNEGSPGIYTRVSRYMDWILATIEP